jgi:trans-L-3-hydroxyproline dehydratase
VQARWATASSSVPIRDGRTDFTIECPYGPVAVCVTDGGRCVGADGVPAFAAELEATIDLRHSGPVILDIGCGGAFYATLATSRLGLDAAHHR